ncbi:MAG: hypothetical protein H0Z28_03260 [Archaeoglobus sp.]|nr:hypothetical protein [Archaeoglobus sp.]
MNSKNKRLVKIFLIGIGIIDSLYLLISSYLDYVAEICPLSGCNSFIYNGINIPALFGLIWFLFYGFTGRFLKLWQLLGVFGIVVLASIALYTEYICPYCFAAYFIGICLIASDRLVKS